MGIEAHFEAAREGIMPPQEVMEALRNSNYWVAYVAIARVNGWTLAPLGQEMPLVAKQMQKKLMAIKKPWLKST